MKLNEQRAQNRVKDTLGKVSPKKKWIDVIMGDMETFRVDKDMVRYKGNRKEYIRQMIQLMLDRSDDNN